MGEDAKSERLVSKTGEGGAVPSTHAISRPTLEQLLAENEAEERRNRRSAIRFTDIQRMTDKTLIRCNYFPTSPWSEYMKREGWKEYPCIKHDKPYCPECTRGLDLTGVCCE